MTLIPGSPRKVRSRRASGVKRTRLSFVLVDTLYRQKHGLTVTGNYPLRDLADRERLHPAIVRHLDDMCTVLEV